MTYGAHFGPGPGDGRYGAARHATVTRGARARAAGVLVVGWVALLWLIEAVDVISGHALDTFGITPREAGELRDVVPAAFLHFGFGHLAANSAPLLVMGFLAALSGMRRFLGVIAVIILASGLGVWLTAPAYSTTAGASGVVFGLFGYLVLRGFVDRRTGDVLLGLLVGAVYGSLLWGVVPTASGVSWQGHLFGLLGGVAAALVFRRPKAP